MNKLYISPKQRGYFIKKAMRLYVEKILILTLFCVPFIIVLSGLGDVYMLQNIVRFVILLIEIALLVIFILPFYKHISNIGNIVGFGITICLIIITLFWDYVLRLIIKLWHNIGGRILLIILAALILVSVIWCIFISIRMVAAYKNYPKKETTVVVLGCKVNKYHPSKMLRHRLEAAYDYLSKNENIKCIVTGGQGPDERITEADCMYDYLVNLGISPNRIIKEDKATNTYENIKFSFEIIEQMNLPKDITIVTDGFHEYRASIIANKQGVKAYSVYAKTTKIDLPYYWLREWMGLFQELYLKPQ